jgi:methyl-accepting chemotaxis protein
MTIFSDLKLVFKISILTALLSLVGIAGAMFATGRMSDIDNAYSDLISGEASAAINLSRASGDADLIVIGIGNVLMSTTDAGNKAADALRDGASSDFGKHLDAAAHALPAMQTEIAAMGAKLKNAVAENCKEALRLGTASTTAAGNELAQNEFLKNCQTAIEPIIKNLQLMSQKLVENNDQDSNRLTSETNRSIITVRVGVFIAIAVAFLLSIFVAHYYIAKPITSMSQSLGELARNNLDIRISGEDGKDEIGSMARALIDLRKSLAQAARAAVEQQEFKAKSEVAQKQAMLRLADGFERSVKGVVDSVFSSSTELQSTAQSLAASAEQASRQSATVAAASEETSVSVQVVASSAEQLTASISEISQQVNQAAQGTAEVARNVDGVTEAAQVTGTVASEMLGSASGLAKQAELLRLEVGKFLTDVRAA